MAQPAPKIRNLLNLEKYRDVPMLTEAGKTTDEWDDSMIITDISLPLFVLDQKTACDYISGLLSDLALAVTEVTAYHVLVLAWNMRSETDARKRIFPETSPAMAKKRESDLSTLQSLPLGSEISVKIPEGDEEREEFIRQGCFLAASLLKMFTKEHSAWIKAKDHIADSYKKFTEARFELFTSPISDQAVSALRRLFQTKDLFKNTLGSILYSLNSLTEGRGMTTMLFEQHLSYTGLHVVGLFCKAIVGLKTEPGMLLNALYTKAYEAALDQLLVIIKKYMGSTEAGIERETYKYARLYNPHMFSLLQTKNCPDLVCILGHIGKSCGNIGGGDVMGIAALAGMSEKSKEIFEKVALNIYTYFKVDLPGAENEMYQVDRT
uniref:Nucleoprotein n=1 Tax=Phlox pilosa virus 1 TaxID=2793736 RepID=A0A8D9PH21_9RHAB|nr:TPA_asm: N [Phlox pilosa virus 1]